jgi:hypothetical protein
MDHIIVGRKLSSSTQNVAINAIKFYFKKLRVATGSTTPGLSAQ